MTNTTEVSNESHFFAVLKSAMNLPGVKINRNDFLRKELSIYYPKSVVNLAIEKNPAAAGIPKEKIEQIAKSCINYETNKVTFLSGAAGIPGGIALAGTVPADTAQYFAHIVRIVQKLVYLFGWKELYNANEEFDDETTNQLTLFLGVMFGVNSANVAVSKLAKVAVVKVEKDIAKRALTKGTIYPIVKKIAERLGVKMTKEVFAKSVGKVIPLIGGVISGGLTYATFKPSAIRLKNYLIQLPIADVESYKSDQTDIIDADFVEINED
ncbi:hypothetical protein [Halalkalibacillus halophilus]|uniref:hypothetical protein n=1 Tax=Halalkalibacillus halophilus TaxID=392827 RepID=UPI000403CD2A|nr:hypothetical protein [Halalkalibacillus halophilus]